MVFFKDTYHLSSHLLTAKLFPGGIDTRGKQKRLVFGDHIAEVEQTGVDGYRNPFVVAIDDFANRRSPDVDCSIWVASLLANVAQLQSAVCHLPRAVGLVNELFSFFLHLIECSGVHPNDALLRCASAAEAVVFLIHKPKNYNK